jgi:hypothetical protein
VLATLLFFAACCVTNNVSAQTQTPGGSGKSAPAGDRKGTTPKSGKTDGKGALAAAQPDAAARAAGPSADYQESLRKTVERRRQRRARRQQNAGEAAGAVGSIVPWPMPPALIIRHTRDVHGEVSSLLSGVRR